jgi:EAL domain-containing protein (putative c-di-GMP-specific phosphodiesterase class I)
MSIAATIIEIGRHFGLEVVAEGVERPSQLAALRRLGCALVQGHLLCPPTPLEDLGDIAERCLDSALLPTH